jgi:hypothetical protein
VDADDPAPLSNMKALYALVQDADRVLNY